MSALTRRDVLAALAVGAGGFALSPLLGFAQTSGRGKKVLFFTRSADFPHPVVTRKNPDELAFAEQVFKDVVTAAGYDVTVSKDGGLFEPGKIEQWDAFAFYTTGRLTNPTGARGNSDKSPGMSAAGLEAFFKAIQSGKGFMGFHCASDTFHSQKNEDLLRPIDAPATVDPYIAMLGGEFIRHGAQQKATIRVADNAFPGFDGLKDYEMTEEWYGLVNLDPKMHVLLVQDTTTMIRPNGQPEAPYRRDPYPCAWAKRFGQGRVFYTSMGHREDVWTSETFQTVMKSGLAWISGNVDAETPPNLEKACPKLAATIKPS